MSKSESFNFERGRGIVWVCDIENSSKYLNDKKYVDYLENFLTRFHWFSRRIVNAANGQYIKWTGDGFLAWFACPLKRDLENIAASAFEAAWNTTFITNVTQMALESDIRISVRNALTFEEDALITNIDVEGNKSVDLLGRSVVLCFRLSSIESDFPRIISHGDLVFEKNSKFNPNPVKMNFTEEEINKYFKGEKWNTDNVYRAEFFKGFKNRFSKSKNKEFKLEDVKPTDFSMKIQSELLNGPEWSQKLYKEYINFLRNDMYSALKHRSSALKEYMTKEDESDI